MKNIFLGYDLNKNPIYWGSLDIYSSMLLAGLSGSGKSFITDLIIKDAIKKRFKVFCISEKVYVDFKQSNITRINPLIETAKLNDFITLVENELLILKGKVEASQFSHISKTESESRTLVIVDELWAIAKIEKTLKVRFENLCEKIIRQGRYLGLYILFISQSSSTDESDIPIRQCSIILSGKTPTKQLSESICGSDILYSNPALKNQGVFIFWNRHDKPKIIIVPINGQAKGIKKWIYKLLNKI